ncbi:RimJ/RimL family protein N-acetyltransferase [Novosphingobium kunmingense]|uniref:RimJ/RimL family protein N-acetyltransferase n=1 Tax=Novosphingobium kunmingense TaxID=1211806 RepID=A0A2N0H6K1_9SPHN|nr:GNAT family protein [Novosphingobium kunmingense]PKB14568.1 RimJ/RimL family protein N-acetyltransferase [Novosphingobium kunmingense]
MDRQPVLEGERLVLRPLRGEDWDALYAVARDPEIWAIHPQPNRWQEPVFRQFVADALAGGGALVAIDKADGSVVGSSQYKDHDPTDGGSVEIGWTFLARSHWGGAFNRELKRLMLSHALGSVSRVDFRVGEANLRSCRAMEKIGGRLTGQTAMVDTPTGPMRHVYYEITRESFAAGPLFDP